MFDENEHIKCPRCHEEYLHHSKVSVFTRIRGEDDPLIQKVSVGDTDVAVEIGDFAKDNPSGRRNGIAIHFWCEYCSEWGKGDMVLHIYQAKGNTYMEWKRPFPPRAK